jgi:hypothetical protein
MIELIIAAAKSAIGADSRNGARNNPRLPNAIIKERPNIKDVTRGGSFMTIARVLARWAVIAAIGPLAGCGGPSIAATQASVSNEAALFRASGYSLLQADEEPGPPGEKGTQQRFRYCALYQCASAADKRWCMRRCVFSWDL